MASGPWIFASEDGKRLDVRHEVVGRIVDDKVALFQSTESSQTLSGTVQKTICVVYGGCAVRLIARTYAELGIVYEVESKVGRPVDGCLPVFPHVGQLVRLSTGDAIPLGEQPFSWTVPGQVGVVEHHRWRLLLPAGCRIEWPVGGGGEGTIENARLGVVLPFPEDRDRYEMVLQIV